LLVLSFSSSPVSGFSDCCAGTELGGGAVDAGGGAVDAGGEDCWFSWLLIWLLGCIGCGDV